MYGPDGAIQAQMETNEEQAGREISQVLFDQQALDRVTTTEQIDESDSQRKLDPEDDTQTQYANRGREPATILHRIIDYF